MNNNQNICSIETKYNPFKDANFWVAFVLGSGPILLIIISKGFILQAPFLLNIIFLVVWELWIIFKKGRKGSLLVGFIIAIIVAGISFFPAMKIEEQIQRIKSRKVLEKFRQQMQVDIEKMKQQQGATQKTSTDALRTLDKNGNLVEDVDNNTVADNNKTTKNSLNDTQQSQTDISWKNFMQKMSQEQATNALRIMDKNGNFVGDIDNNTQQSQAYKGWVVYKNEELGFSIMHPPNWEKGYHSNSIKTEGIYGESLSFMRVYTGVSNFEDLKKKIGCYREINGIKTDISIIINIKNRQWLFCDKDPNLMSLFDFYTIYPNNNEYLVVMANSESGTEKSIELGKVTEEMLKTFSFLD